MPTGTITLVPARASRGSGWVLTTMNEAASEAFRFLTGWTPMRWQQRLLDMLLRGKLPTALALPTGLGKTSVMTLWLIARAFGADLPRRLVYVVDRRVVVDQASAEARKLQSRLNEPSPGSLQLRLRKGLGLDHSTSLAVSTLRGGLIDDPAWRVDPAGVAIIVGTVDMIGSRLLFEGYGVSRRMRPLHAGLLGCDTLAVLDEAHLVPPFAALLHSIEADASLRANASEVPVPTLRLMTLSATGREAAGGQVFRLTEEEAKEALVARRLQAAKRLHVKDAMPAKDLPGRLAAEAERLAGSNDQPARVVVFCDSRRQAQEVAARLNKRLETLLLVGERRGHERAEAADHLAREGFIAGSPRPGRPAVLVATAAGEVGVDLDANHMVADVVAFERMVQRLGRVNRRGENPAPAEVVLVPAEPKAKAGAADTARHERARATLRLLDHLPQAENGRDASPAALTALQQEPTLEAQRQAATTPEPLRPALTRALLDAWSLTSLDDHPGRPEIAPWLRGWTDEEPETRLFWRRHLPWREGETAVGDEVAEFFDRTPPAPTELLEAPVWRAVEVLKERANKLRNQGLPKDAPALIVLDPALAFERALTLGDVQGLDAKNGHFADRYLAVSAMLGGLSEEGLLDETAEGIAPDAPSALRGIGCTADAPEGMRGVPWRCTVGPPEAEEPPGEGFVEAHAWVLERDEEGGPRQVLRLWTTEPGKADQALARRAESLADHAAAVEAEISAIAGRLGLLADAEYRRMLCLAARLHDSGKAATRWQDAFAAPKDGRPYAKTAAGRVDHALLDGYRHEFGSLAAALDDPDLAALPAELRDLALHLIAAHHGRARPTIETRGADLMPSCAEAIEQEAALRFARLQRRWGPWGLAWWEALLRCADAAASAKLEQG